MGVQGVQGVQSRVQVVQESQPGVQVVQPGVQEVHVVQGVQSRVQVVQVVQPGIQEVQVVQESQPGAQVVQVVQGVQPGAQVVQEVLPGVQEVQPGSQPDAAQQNFCPSSSVLKTRSSCHPCSASPLMLCPPGYSRSPGAPAQDCRYSVRTPSRTLWVDGCSFQCYRETPLRGCCPGYWGAQCQACPDEARRPCRGRGVCSDGLGGDGSCNCTEGFAGSACEDCAKDRFGPTCSSECTCVHGLCNSGLSGDGRCTCFSGYKGPRCDQELPACAALGCRQQGSGCGEEALTGRLVCRCLPGYQQQGAQCIAINPCLRPVCHAQASCVPTGAGQHLCACLQGYSGDGRVCTPRDPCQDRAGGCPPHAARCVYDGPGKSHCECLPGFQRQADGGCLLKDACSPGSCHPKANCTTTGPGLVQCSCLQGYVGNGKVCYGNLVERLRELNTDPSGQWRGQLGSAISLFNSVEFPLSNLGPFTVLVPVNKGFRGISVRSLTADASKARYLCKLHLVGGVLPAETLSRSHVFYTLTGKSVEVESEEDSQPKIRISGSRKKASILQSDLVASNGLIHIISKLMESIAPTVDSKPEENLMKIISDYGKFLTFQSLLRKAGLASLMDAPGPITVLAPTSTAFSALPEGQLDYLRSPEGHNKLVELLRNHILPSTSLDVFNAVSSARFSTMANQVLDINRTENGQILVGGAGVLEAAVEAKNGRLYVMDGVLTPPSIEPVMPSRCDTTKTRTIQGECVSCSRVSAASCPSGVHSGTSTSGCLFYTTFRTPPIRIPTRGCSPICNATITTPACCGGFYGPDCSPCPGGFQTPCSGHGQCDEGMAGGGACTCRPNFSGSRCQYCSSPQKYGPRCDQTCPCIHGQCDNRPDSDGRCKPDSCRAGHTGRFCERQTAACGAQVRFCHAHADCDFSEGTPRCVCKPGFQGDGITCVASDPCAPPLRGGCSVNAKCIELGPGKHTCRCLIGWTEMGDECRPINNCQGPSRGGCHPNASCIYVGPGQSDCSCKAGYRGDGLRCEPVNQCVTEAGGCHYLASCRLLSSGWTCVCDAGYVGDGLVCYGSVQEELMTLPNASDFYSWTRESGLSESLSEQNITLLVPTSAAVSQMSPEDRSFWTRKGNLPALIRNHVVPGTLPLTRLRDASSLTSLLTTSLPVSSRQEVTSVGGATIVTPDLAATNGVIHLIDKVLVPDRKLSDGLLATLALRPEFSLFRSYLLDYNLTGEIEQADGFTVFAPTDAAVTEHLRKTDANALDVNTTRYHVVPSEVLLKTDLKPGGYKPTLLGSSFQIGIYPRDGKLFVNEALVNSSNILCGGGVIHGLSAVLEIIRNHCDKVTDQKVSGLCVDCLFHQNKICPNDTIPDKSVRQRKCLFSRVFEEKPLLTIGCKTTCIKKIIERRCCSGFFGQRCEPCPGLKGQPCFNNGECLDGVDGSGVCRCNKGFNGTACETCQSGKYGVHCDQECDCKNGRCNEGLKGDGTCECDVGWRGVHCDEKIESKADELCGSVRCHSSANCVFRTSGPECLCAAGFKGNGSFCEAVDPCLLDNGGCSEHAVCKRTRPGRRDCVCHRGYAGDGLVCVEINPCLEGNGGCHANADCIHVGPNKTSCSCISGYSGDGQNCSMINLCKKKNGGCHQHAVCNMTGPGQRSCSCSSSLIGDGLTCRGTVEREMKTNGLTQFYFGLMMAEISLKGRGPFTVFAPKQTYEHLSKMKLLSRYQEAYANLLRGHIVMCHTLLPSDLLRPRNLTSLSGTLLTTSYQQGSIRVNAANLTRSDGPSLNGIIHTVDQVLFPPGMDADKILLVPDTRELNLTQLADRSGYKTFSKLLQDSGVMELVSEGLNRPVTVFLPSDVAMATLPQSQRDFLLHPDHRRRLLETLKYHILQGRKVYAEQLVYLDSARTLQGSALSFSCGGADNIGDIFVNEASCRITERHLVFDGGLAYGVDCLLTPPSLGGRCDSHTTFDLPMDCGHCTSSATRCPKGAKRKEVQKCDLPTMFVSKDSGCRPVCSISVWQPKCCPGYYGRDCLVCPGGVHGPCNNRGKCDDGHFGNGTCTCAPGFGGTACELCSAGFFGPTCKACNCSGHGSCDDGPRGTGSCFCEDGWTGDGCDVQTEVFQCSPPCSPKAACRQNNTCVCRPPYAGDGLTCTVVDMCGAWSGVCDKVATCSQTEEKVSCTCPKGYSGDGFTCVPIDPCAFEDNGGCHEHAICTMTAPGKKTCTCKENFVGDGVTCEAKQLPLSRCLQDNGQCHPDAKCTDLHFEDATLGVFHYRSSKGQYKLNYTEAQQTCTEQGGHLATYSLLSYAQQGGLHVCAASWLDQARVAYPTTYSNPKCGFGHVGIVDYGTRKNLSETWDAFCYRMKEVKCECKPGYVGDGLSCAGNLLQVLTSKPTFSNFLTQVLNYSEVSESGRQFVKRLSNLAVQSTLFVPDNSGLPGNQTLTQRDMESHLSEGVALPLSQMKNGSRIRTRAGSLTVLGVADLLNPSALTSCYINERFVIDSDIVASNGIIHVLQGPLQAPPPQHQMAAAHQAGMGVGVVLLVVLVTGAIFVGYHFYKQNTKPFQFHYFKEDDREEEEEPNAIRSVCNPVYEAGPEASAAAVEDQRGPVGGGAYDLLQDG